MTAIEIRPFHVDVPQEELDDRVRVLSRGRSGGRRLGRRGG
jgi:hypothetical protein